jgi:acyl-CoA thioesterase FadM
MREPDATVAGCRIRRRASARLDDRLEDRLDVTQRRLAVGGATTDCGQQVPRGGEPPIEGERHPRVVDATRTRPTRIPPTLLRALR